MSPPRAAVSDGGALGLVTVVKRAGDIADTRSMSTIRHRQKLSTKLQQRGWEETAANCAAVTVFPMETDPRNRGLERWLRSRASVMAKTLNPRSGFDQQTQQELVLDALDAYAGACVHAGRSDYAKVFVRASEVMLGAGGTPVSVSVSEPKHEPQTEASQLREAARVSDESSKAERDQRQADWLARHYPVGAD